MIPAAAIVLSVAGTLLCVGILCAFCTIGVYVVIRAFGQKRKRKSDDEWTDDEEFVAIDEEFSEEEAPPVLQEGRRRVVASRQNAPAIPMDEDVEIEELPAIPTDEDAEIEELPAIPQDEEAVIAERKRGPKRFGKRQPYTIEGDLLLQRLLRLPPGKTLALTKKQLSSSSFTRKLMKYVNDQLAPRNMKLSIGRDNKANKVWVLTRPPPVAPPGPANVLVDDYLLIEELDPEEDDDEHLI